MLEIKEKHTITEVVKEGLCTSCGICAGACNKQSISFHYGSERNTPIVDIYTCVNCGICYEVCPGKGINIGNISKEIFSRENII